MAVVALCQVAVMAQGLVAFRISMDSQVGAELRSSHSKSFAFLSTATIDVVDREELDSLLLAALAARKFTIAVVQQGFISFVPTFLNRALFAPGRQPGPSSDRPGEFSLWLFIVAVTTDLCAMPVDGLVAPFLLDRPIEFLGAVPVAMPAQIGVSVHIAPVFVELVERLCLVASVTLFRGIGVVGRGSELFEPSSDQSLRVKVVTGFAVRVKAVLFGLGPIELGNCFLLTALAAYLESRYDGVSHDALLSTKDRCGKRPLGTSLPSGFDYYI